MNYKDLKKIQTKQDLMAVLRQYQRWVKDGKPKYKHDYNGGPTQYYYDTYHDGMEQLEDGTFRFDIQIYDSDEGDTWWTGRFKLLPSGVDIEVLEEKEVFRG